MVGVISRQEESQEREKRSQKRERSRVSRSWLVFLSRKKNAVEEQDLTSIAETHTLPLAEDRNDPCPQMWLQRAPSLEACQSQLTAREEGTPATVTRKLGGPHQALRASRSSQLQR